MSIKIEGPTYAEFADALLNQSLQRYRMPEAKKEVKKEGEKKEDVEVKGCRMNLEAIAIEQENL